MTYYVAPMQSGIKNVGLSRHMVATTTPEEAEFWSLYRRDDDGTSAWISDHDTEAQAIAVMEQNRAKDALLASGPIDMPPTREQHGLRMWLADAVAEEILSFGEAEKARPEPRTPAGVDVRPPRPEFD